MVYFQFDYNSPTAVGKMTAACEKYLKDHPGAAYYAAGTLAGEKSMFNDREWDVALHLVFKTKADLDKYSSSERHKQFVDENRSSWKKVQVSIRGSRGSESAQSSSPSSAKLANHCDDLGRAARVNTRHRDWRVS